MVCVEPLLGVMWGTDSRVCCQHAAATGCSCCPLSPVVCGHPCSSWVRGRGRRVGGYSMGGVDTSVGLHATSPVISLPAFFHFLSVVCVHTSRLGRAFLWLGHAISIVWRDHSPAGCPTGVASTWSTCTTHSLPQRNSGSPHIITTGRARQAAAFCRECAPGRFSPARYPRVVVAPLRPLSPSFLLSFFIP